MRDLVAKALKMHRSFEVNQEWVDAKLRYYQWKIDHPDVYKSIEEVPINGWVTVVDRAPGRGARYNEYYAADWGGIESGTYKVKSFHQYQNEPTDVNFFGDEYGSGYRPYYEIRPATEQEVDAAKGKFYNEYTKELLGRQKGYEEQVKMVNDKWAWL